MDTAIIRLAGDALSPLAHVDLTKLPRLKRLSTRRLILGRAWMRDAARASRPAGGPGYRDDELRDDGMEPDPSLPPFIAQSVAMTHINAGGPGC